MHNKKLSQKQLFALSLTAPILVTGQNPQYDTLTTHTAEGAADLLSSWWGIENLQDLQETLHWLGEEGGHTAIYIQWKNHLERMSYLQRQKFIESLKDKNRDDYVRANVVERYRMELGAYSILAFDICRMTLLIRCGYDTGWLTEEEAWTGVLEQADRVINNRMWWSHLDYLYSFAVGRAFGMLRDGEGNLTDLREARTLLTDYNTPWLSYAPWPNFETEVEQKSISNNHPLH